ncbi:MAG: rod shape-determining protein RodA [Patescibacteria group bacterium]|nr:rod shape-determining protein RodA [Patescibacteria group bacterium]
MSSILKKIKEFDFILLTSVAVISGMGLLSLFSVNSDYAYKQMIFIGGGFLIMFIVSFIDWRIFKENSYFVLSLYLVSLASLGGLLIFAREIRGVQRWYEIGPVFFDPAEVFKIILVILLAKYFSTRHTEMYKISHIFLSGLYVAVPVFLIFRQPDLGSALILITAWVAILIVSGIKIRHFMLLVAGGLILLTSGWFFFLEDYQKDRAIAFLEPQLDPQGNGWGQNQAKIAVGSGGFWGKGFQEGTQTQYGFLPEPETDFIFSAIAEEFGFVGVTILLSGFAVFLWRTLSVIIHSRTNFPRLFVTGFVILVLTQAFVNIGMNIGIMPIIGTPLPLVSYGGSNLLFVFLGLGIIQSLRRDI